MLKLKLLLLLPGLALGATQKFESQDAGKIYEALNITEVVLEEHDVEPPGRCHIWTCPGYSRKLISVKEKAIAGLNCKKNTYQVGDIMANGGVRTRISSGYECLKNYYLNSEQSKNLYKLLSHPETIINYDNRTTYLKDFGTFVIEKDEYQNHNNVNLDFYHKKQSDLYHEEAKALYNLIQSPVDSQEYYDFKTFGGIKCRKTKKSSMTNDLIVKEYYCGITSLSPYKFERVNNIQ